MPLPPPTPHPLPWHPPGDWVHLEPNWRGDLERPYALRIGRASSTIATFTPEELIALRDRITAVLDAPYRVIVAGSGGRPVGDPQLTAAVRERLDKVHARYPRMELATERELTPAGRVAEQWAVDTGVPRLLYDRYADAVRGGGNLAILVAGADGPRLADSAAEAGVAIWLIRVEATA